MNDLNTLREHLFGTLEALRDKENPMAAEQAKAIVQVAQSIIDTAKVEVDFLRVTNRDHGSGFIPEPEEGPPKFGSQPRQIKGSAMSGGR